MVQNLPGGQIKPTLKIIFFEKYEVEKKLGNPRLTYWGFLIYVDWDNSQNSKISKNHNK